MKQFLRLFPSGSRQSSQGKVNDAPRTLLWRSVAAYTGAICVAMVIQVFCALNWGNNYLSDEAIFALMALHISQGQFVAYVYGSHYQGSGEALLAAGLFKLFGPDILVFRAAALLLFAVYLALHALVVTRLWNRRAALISLLFLAAPGYYILVLTYRPMGPFIIPMLCVAGSLLLIWLPIGDRRLHLLRMLALGALTGLGIWSHQLMLSYLAALALTVWLSSPEWAECAARFERWCARALQIPGSELLLLLAVGAGGLVVLGFFSAACEPVSTFAKVQTAARALLALGGLGLAGALLAVSARRGELIGGGVLLLAGVGLGTLPQWLSLLFEGYPVQSAILPSCPTGAAQRLKLVVTEMLPAAWGLLPLPDLASQSALLKAAWALLLAITGATVCLWLWRTRLVIWALITLRPLTPQQRLPALLALAIGLPVGLAAVGGNTVNIYSVRYLLFVWVFGAILFGVMLAQLSFRRPRVAALLSGVWLALIALPNLSLTLAHWPTTNQFYTAETVGALERYLAGQNVSYGYADFWDGFTLDFLTQERLVIAPFNHMDRYPPYTAQVSAEPVQFYLFVAGQGPAGSSTADLIDFLKLRGPVKASSYGFPWVIERLQRQRVLRRDRVARWDIWLVSDR